VPRSRRAALSVVGVWSGLDALRNTRDLTDTQWAILDDLIPKPERRKDRRGRPRKDRRPS